MSVRRIEVNIDATDFESEMTAEIELFRDAVLSSSPYPLYRALTTDMFYPQNDSVVSILRRRGDLVPASDGSWENTYYFPNSVRYVLLQNNNDINITVQVPKWVKVATSSLDGDNFEVQFIEPWYVRILDPVIIKGKQVRFEQRFDLVSVNSEVGVFRYLLRSEDKELELHLSAVYQSSIDLAPIDVKFHGFGSMGILAQSLMKESLQGGPCGGGGGGRRRRVPSDGPNITLHIRILSQPNGNIDTMVQNTIDLFQDHGFIVREGDRQNLTDLDDLLDLEIDCFSGRQSAEQGQLYRHRDGIPDFEIAAYFVRSTIPANNGCASFTNTRRPACVVTNTASDWTLAHEIGHVLGLNHVNDSDRLMTGGGTANITNLPPDLVDSEVSTMQSSHYTKAS